MVAGAMMSVSHVYVGSPSAELFVREPRATDVPSSSSSCSGGLRLPSTSLGALSSRAALSGGSKFSCLLREGRNGAAGMKGAAMGITCAAVTSTVDLNARRPEVETAIDEAIGNCISETHLNDTIPALGPKIRGKVRDIYEAGDYMVLVTTDRQSAFDRVLASVPFKGQVLNQTSVWWFNNTKHITDNAVVSAPDPNVTIAKKCTVFPVEFVVRGFMTGSTSTSLWTVYNQGVRNYCGNDLVEGMKKNEKLEANIITPTTKAADHDLPISGAEIVEQGLMSKEDYEEVKNRALALFKFGQEVALKHGLLLVDTKYEFGKTSDGTIVLIDEVHTPDSSRYWIAASYEERQRQGLEPENIDKVCYFDYFS
ncbi:hypothetical protein M758_N008800 [Ceratodon purpureus]|nr:hypothetical protein M758_N008800 [Ceratodon purpureus]KAG0504888.1 hypothetical protein M758_N008800 [Ceratodon purpureus]